jgi:hypothetical protein
MTIQGGSAAAPSLTFSGDTNTGIFSPAADTIAFSEGGVESMRIDASGNLLIGRTTQWDGEELGITGSASSMRFLYARSTSAGHYLSLGTNGTAPYIEYGNGAGLIFRDGSTERARIDSSGNLLVGDTSYGPYTTRLTLKYAGTTRWSVGPNNTTDSFYVSSSASSTGVYITSSGTSWTSNSDERLKTTLKPFENAVEKVCTLRAGTGRYLTDEESVSRSFLIAQDVQVILPEAVNVQDDEQRTLGLQYQDLIPLLTAAIQELKAELDATKAEVALLKGAA